MALRIACDLDGTLADMESALQREAERLFGPGVDVRAAGLVIPSDQESEPEPVENGGSVGPALQDESGPRALTSREMSRLWDHVRSIENFWTTLSEIEPGAVARIAALKDIHGWEVLFVTQRPSSAGETAQVQTQRWLEAHGFELPSVFVMNGSRGRLADALALDAVVDDRAENALDITTDSNARSILVWRGPRAGVPAAATRLGIHVVFSFAEAVDTLEQMMTRPTAPQRILNRVRAAIGI